ncbi:ABC transporter permease [Halobaculum marinum]|uniref:ABC-2 type transport system permease protein n=1 Tax=Halobaculum marinum TaxID=3031996 RepID=A0ABD5WQL4_9EURY|nr:ABC transporter permease [Halobaculum sp. DT55]
MITDTASVTGASSPASAAWAVCRFEAERRLRASLWLAVGLTLFGLLFVWIGPDIVAGGEVDQLLDSMPAPMVALLGFETLSSLAGLLAGEFYTFGWVVALAGYVAYSAANGVARPLRDDRMETLLAASVPRTSVLLGTFLALLVPIAVANVAVPAALYAGSVAVGHPLDPARLFVLHVLAVPFLLSWGALGVLFGVVVRRGRTAGRAALGAVFAAWLVESFTSITEYEWVGAVAPSRYFDPAAVLVDGTTDLAGMAVLCVATVGVLAVSAWLFARWDL